MIGLTRAPVWCLPCAVVVHAVALVPHHHVPPEGTPSLTGLEGSAVGGQGTGIVPFVPSRQMFSLTSTNLKVDISPFVNEALKGFGSAAGNGSAGWCPRVDH